MSIVTIEDTNLTNIANAIRIKNGTSDTYKPSEMASAIENITTGGSGGSSIAKGFVVNACDADGYITDASIVGFVMFPEYYFYGGSATFLKNIGENLHFEEGLANIGSSAFYGQYGITKINLPSSFITISDRAFYNCRGLIEVTMNNSGAGYINTRAFYNCSNLIKFILNVTKVLTLDSTDVFTNTPIASGTGYIYVPDDLVASYKAKTNWSTYADQIKPISELEA